MRNIILLVLSTFFLSLSAQSYKDDLFTSYFQRSDGGWIASDGTISLPLPDGRTMWMMGDAHVDQTVDQNNEIPCLFNTRSCILVQDDMNRDNISTFYNANGADVYQRQFVQMERDDRVTYWPAHGLVEADTAYTFWTRYAYDSTEVWNLKLTGMVVAKIKLPEMELSEVVPIKYPEIEYGMAIVKSEEDGYYYIYGKYLDWIVFKPVLARCRFDELTGDWEFYSGSGTWSDSPDDAAFIAEEAAPEYSVFYLNGEYHMFYQQNGYLQCGEGREMYIYSSENPEGPFENPVWVYTMEDRFLDTFPLTYNGQAHPQFIENDELLISYNVNNVCPSVCADDPFGARYNPDLYRPKFARVPVTMFSDPSSNVENIERELLIGPNPSSGIFYLGREAQHYTVFDIHGNLVSNKLGRQIDLSHCPDGTYFLQIKGEKEAVMKKLIKY